MKILLGLTGSVATVLYQKLIAELQTLGEVEVIVTAKSKHFIDSLKIEGVKVWTDEDEWKWTRMGFINATIDGVAYSRPVPFVYDKWEKNDRVLHIDLRDQNGVFVIAPCSANTLGKITNGICDNLLTSVARAWDRNRPLIIAPAMNTHMWNHPLTKEQLEKFKTFSENNSVVNPQSKMLACNTEGMGALANISDIVAQVKNATQWHFPLHSRYSEKGGFWTPLTNSDLFEDAKVNCTGIPQAGHAGAFKTCRKHHTHTGVDLYTNDGETVHAVEDGTVVAIEDFTGTSQNSPWWEDTRCVLVEGASGVVCYGEITPANWITVGTQLKRGNALGNVKRVLKLGKERPDIDGHSTSMLHMEVYKHGIRKSFEEDPSLGELSDWNILIDPTPMLMNAKYRPDRLLMP
jgi:phosphopantothenoylcysteine decarboxylase